MNVKQYLTPRNLERGAVAALALLSLVTWMVVWRMGLVLSYNDSMSHLDIARRIVDDVQPGLSQIGTVWLPLSHILYLPLVWNYWAWHTGFAGSLVSMASFVLAAMAIYLTVRELTGSRWAAVVGTAALALNINELYLQSTPLTEPLYVALLSWSIYLLVRYLRTDDARFLIGLGALSFLQIMARYDGWFVVIAQGAVVLGGGLIAHKPWRDALGRTLLVLTPAAFGVSLWLMWNASFGDPLYFAVGAGSAKAQQSVIAASSGLAAKGHLPLAGWLYMHTVADNIGLTVLALGMIGIAWWVWSAPGTMSRGLRWLLLGALLAPLAFNVLALYLGFSTISIPELGGVTGRGQWFNVRYGIIMLPVAAIGLGLLTRWRALIVPLILVIALQGLQMWQQGPITVLDGTRGSSAFTDADISSQLAHRVHPGEHVLMSFSTFNPVGLASGLDLNQFIHEGAEHEWQATLADPAGHTNWVVTSRYDTGDPVYTALVKEHPGVLNGHFKLVFTGTHANLYQRVDPAVSQR